MTISARNWAWDCSRVTRAGDHERTLKPGEKLTLIFLAEMENAEEGCAFPSHETIAKATCQSVRTVQDHLKALGEMNAFNVQRRRTRSGKWLRHVYYLNVPDSYREKDPEWLRYNE